ncbi:MAG: undecaprenyl-diphosphate phosphatase [Candidatus Bipolaricaulota bacterium]
MIRYAIVGIVQGLTEFLPISSSAHIVLAEALTGLKSPGIVLEAAVHVGTLAAVLVAFRADVAAILRSFGPRGSLELRKEVGLLIVGTVPIVALGLALRSVASRLFESLWIVGGGLLLTAVAVIVADQRARRGARRSSLGAPGAFGVGLAQAVALVPGVSRSGVTMAAGVAGGLSPARAARFSFLLSIPAVAGAAIIAVLDARSLVGGHGAAIDVAGVLVGAVAAFVVGLAALRFLLAVLRRGRLWGFAVYCAALAMATWVGAMVLPPD